MKAKFFASQDPCVLLVGRVIGIDFLNIPSIRSFILWLAVVIANHKMSADDDSNAPVTKAEFSEVLTMMNAVKEQMREMKCDLSNERDVADEVLVKKMRMDKGVQFKWKGNEKQHQFNELLSHSCHQPYMV